MLTSLRFSSARGRKASKSARYFSFVFDRSIVTNLLEEHVKYVSDTTCKIRLLLSRIGNVTITSEKIDLPRDDIPLIVAISNKTTDSSDPSYFHKTTMRDLYQSELARCQRELGCFDVLFTNERGELTEGCFTNLIIEKNGLYLTPPIDSGLLNGIYRQEFIDNNEKDVREKCLFPADLRDADRIYLCNSVRGLIQVHLTEKSV